MRSWGQWFVGLSGISEPKVLPETFRQVMYALACATGWKVWGNGGILWYLLICVCLGMRDLMEGAEERRNSPVFTGLRMSGHAQHRVSGAYGLWGACF